MEKVEAKKLCKEHMHRYVCVQMHDGAHYDGIMENVDDDMIYLAVPVGNEAMVNQANWGPNMMPVTYPTHSRGFFPGFGYPYPYYGYGRRRFNRLVLPLIGLTALSLLPYY
ncbi:MULTISPECIES: hypothetical protein [unclassified Paenibacillus]|uniref:hypothetical protein n=1 Tax=unclassified Paenibacillus TaxID=185978 RepID=UPI00041C555D|nr:hypothetical protein P364_0101860 [Paenibacillus sp. MAEPY2]KGP85750.1 hypothetical protein P363_0120615 [Paenibacillus sp. MAEPY1]